jgi:hypothetical protein
MAARTVPVMATEAPGGFLTGALWNANVKALGDFLSNPPVFSGYAVASQSIPNNTFTAMSIDTEVFDSDGGHSTTTNTSRYTCQVAGLYLLSGEVVLPASGAGTRGAEFMVNGITAVIGSEQLCAPSPGFATTIAPTASYVRLAVGDYVQLMGFQNSGGAVSTSTVGAAMTSFAVEWVTA